MKKEREKNRERGMGEIQTNRQTEKTDKYTKTDKQRKSYKQPDTESDKQRAK